MPASPYYRSDLARIHHEGFGFHADAVAPGILTILEPVLERGGLVLELGCGSGLLTKSLVEAGHRVLATDASPAMVDLARDFVPTVPVEVLRLPEDPLPTADAIVSVGHALSYLDSEEDIDRSLAAIAGALEDSGYSRSTSATWSGDPPDAGSRPGSGSERTGSSPRAARSSMIGSFGVR